MSSPAAASMVGRGSSYGPQSGTAEWERLDYQYEAIRDYFAGKFCLAPLGAPRRILELGAGSGAWAIHAAQEFPEAEVVAADIAPLPPRALPPNVRFESVDITALLPFKPGTFDVVHVRFVICHLSHGAIALARIVELVAPGGWLLVEEMDAPTYIDGDAPGVKNMFAAYPEYMRTKDQDPEISRTLEQQIRGFEGFEDVNADTICVPLGAAVDMPGLAMRGLSAVLTRSFIDAYTGKLSDAARQFGITEEMQKAACEEAATRSWKGETVMLWTWSRKRSE